MDGVTYQDVMQALKNADAAGDTQAATRLAQIANQLASQQAPEESSLRQVAGDVARQVGLAGRYAIEGVGGVADILASPIRGAINLVAPESIQARPVAPQIADLLNLPRPETPTERIVGEAAKGVAGAGTGVGLAKLTQPVTRAGQAVRQIFTAAPGTQLASAGAAGAGSTFAAELGMDETQQMLAGVGAGLAPAVLPAAATRTLASVPTQMRQIVQEARQAGFTLPPSQTNPSITNKVLESLSGKIKTNQAAAQKNQEVTNNMAKKALGIPQDQPLSQETLNTIRAGAGQAYDDIANIGTVNAGTSFTKRLDKIVEPYVKAAEGFPESRPNPIIDEINSLKTESFSASAGIAKIRELREASDSAFAAGNKALGKSYRDAATAIEDAIDNQAKQLGNAIPEDLLKNFRDARKLIAKTYSVQKALNDASGNVVATNLAAQLKRGAPLESELRTIARTAQAFPKAVQSLDQLGQNLPLSPLDVGTALLGYGTLGGPGAAGLIARPAARQAILSTPYQAVFGRPGGIMGSQVTTPEQFITGGLLGAQYGME